MFINSRHTIRLRGYDYSSDGWYFVTVCTQNREDILGKISDGCMSLNEFGKMVKDTIDDSFKYKDVFIDTYCLMPNHIHMILVIVGAGLCASPTNMDSDLSGSTHAPVGSTQRSTTTLGEYVKRFKTKTTFVYTENVKKNNWTPFNRRVWQRNYYERIIRNEKELNQIRQYIHDNPMNWEKDGERLSG